MFRLFKPLVLLAILAAPCACVGSGDLQERVSGQIVGDDGKPLALSLKGQGGIEELVTITVVGVVTEKNDEGLMVVNASGVHVKKG